MSDVDFARALIEIKVLENQINHNNLYNYSGNQHIDWTGATNNFKTTGSMIIGDVLYVNGSQSIYAPGISPVYNVGINVPIPTATIHSIGYSGVDGVTATQSRSGADAFILVGGKGGHGGNAQPGVKGGDGTIILGAGGSSFGGLGPGGSGGKLTVTAGHGGGASDGAGGPGGGASFTLGSGGGSTSGAGANAGNFTVVTGDGGATIGFGFSGGHGGHAIFDLGSGGNASLNGEHGRMGINNYNPLYTLDVNGDIGGVNVTTGTDPGHIHTAIGQNTGSILANTGSIVKNTGSIVSNLILINQNTGSITDNTGSIASNLGLINANIGSIADNTGSIASNLVLINQNTGSITNNTGSIGDNLVTINQNTGSIADNTGSIISNLVLINNNIGSAASNLVLINQNIGSITDNRDAIAGISGTNYWTGSNANIYNNNGGNVGIGTATPTGKLEVLDGGTVPNAGGVVDFHADDRNVWPLRVFEDSYSSVTPILGFLGNNDGRVSIYNQGTNIITLDDGKVGIGTVTPSSKLDVVGAIEGGQDGTTSQGLKLYNDNTTAGRYTEQIFSTSGGVAPCGIRGIAVHLSSNHDSELHFFTAKGGSTKNVGMVLNEDSFVGIGTAAPAQRLHVSGTTAGMRVDAGGANTLLVSGGKVGIRTSAPTQTLDVSGNANITNSLFVNYVDINGGIAYLHSDANSVGYILNAPTAQGCINNVQKDGVNMWSFGISAGINDFGFYNTNSGAQTFLQHFDWDDNMMGVGTTNPLAKVHIIGDNGLGSPSAPTPGQSGLIVRGGHGGIPYLTYNGQNGGPIELITGSGTMNSTVGSAGVGGDFLIKTGDGGKGAITGSGAVGGQIQIITGDSSRHASIISTISGLKGPDITLQTGDGGAAGTVGFMYGGHGGNIAMNTGSGGIGAGGTGSRGLIIIDYLPVEDPGVAGALFRVGSGLFISL